MNTLPAIVHIGFSGSRHLFDAAAHPGLDAAAFEAALAQQLASALGGLHAELGLSPQHALRGISQIAIGGDFVFTVACGASGIPQCIYLPQPLDAYLAAADPQGHPDFTPDEAARARILMASEHIVDARVIAAGNDRIERFEKVNLAILDDSDLVICLIGLDGRKRGGASAMREMAVARGKPVLLLQVAVREDGSPGITRREWLGKDRFALRSRTRAPL